MVTAEPDQRAGELEEAEVVAGLLVPADRDRAALRKPSQGTLDHPPPRPVELFAGRALVAPEHAAWAWDRYGVKPGRFAAVLVGKDGAVKSGSGETVDCEDLHAP